MRIKDLTPEDRPREKALLKGIGSLSDAELLALCIGSGTKGNSALEIAHTLLREHGGLSGFAESENVAGDILGLSENRMLSLSAVAEICRRTRTKSSLKMPDESSAIYENMRVFTGKTESIYVFALNAHKRIKRVAKIAEGSDACTSFDVKSVLAVLVTSGCKKFVLAHTHIGDDPRPSKADIEATYELAKGAALLGCELTDHIIICEESRFSFAQAGLLICAKSANSSSNFRFQKK